jgi:hypothetical protein
MKIMNLQQIIDQRISFLNEQINPENKPQVNKMFQLQIEAIRSIDDDYAKDKVESIIKQKKALLKTAKMCMYLRGYLQSMKFWDGWGGKQQDIL